MAPLQIGSLFTGTGALDLAVMDVFAAEVVWHSQYEPPDKNGKEDTNQYAAKILAGHWPDVPNLWDITKVDWQAVRQEHGPVDILTGGFPCQDVSSAGKRAGLTADSRSGLWTHFARAIRELNPRLVVIENVEGLLSAPADRGLGLDVEALEEEAQAGRVLRALGAVLGDLATLGFHAEWERVGADDVGAPHRRRRVIIYAWQAAFDPRGFGWGDGSRVLSRLGAAGRGAEAVQDADVESGGERRFAASGQAEGGRSWADAGGRGGAPASDAGGAGLKVGGVEPDRYELATAERGGRESAADSNGVESERRRVAEVLRGQAAAEPSEGNQRKRARHAARDSRADAAEPACPTCGCEESFHDAGGFCAGCHGCTDPELGRPAEAVADADGRGREGHQERHSGPEGEQPERQRGLDPVGCGVRRKAVEAACVTCLCPASDHDADGLCVGCLHCTDSELGQPGFCPDDCPVCADEADADAEGDGRHEGRTEPARQQGRPDAAQPCGAALADADRVGCRADVLDLRPGQPDLDWGDYEPAIRRWERVLGRRAPWPTDALGRLSPVFTEWLMGLPDGWVTDTPGLTRPAMLRALGNGVVWQQAAYALRRLHARAVDGDAQAAA